MGHAWGEHISFENPATKTRHLIRSTGHALIFLTEQWQWRKAAAYHDAVMRCILAFEADQSQDNARDAFLAALISAGLIDGDWDTIAPDLCVAKRG